MVVRELIIIQGNARVICDFNDCVCVFLYCSTFCF